MTINIRILLLSILIYCTIPQIALAQDSQQRVTWSSASSHGAKMIRGISNLEDLKYMWWNEVTQRTVDSTKLEVVYKLKYRRHNKPEKPHLWMLTKLQSGYSHSKYFSIICQFIDDVQQVVMEQVRKSAKMPGVGYSYPYTEEELAIKNNSGKDYLNSEIWIDYRTQQIKERTHDYARHNLSVEYEEPLPQFEWELMEAIEAIAGYAYSTAKTTFRGREWTVWYTIEIPVSTGPWKFNGLPGLILKAQDEKMDYIWECQNISQRHNPIVYYEVDKQMLTRSEWLHHMRQIHNSPLEMLGEDGTTVFIYNDKSIIESDNWTIPYNPIELE